MLVDSRVGSLELVDPLIAMGLPAESALIDGDIAFEGRGAKGVPVCIGLEYKKLGELVQSLRSERLQGHQLLKMQKAFDFRWLLVEGEVLTNADGYLARWARVKGKRVLVPLGGRMTLTELYKRILVLQICGGLTPFFTANREESLRFIEAIYRMWTDTDMDQHKSHIAIYEPAPLIPISQFRRTVATLPGIGIEMSGRIEKHFKSLKAALNAPVAEWTQIEGIGTKTAEGVQKALR